MIVLILKSLSQLLVLAVGVTSVIQAHLVRKSSAAKKTMTRVGWLTLAMLISGFVVFIATDLNERRENSKKDAGQQKTIAELQRVNQSLFSMRADRDLSGMEISFKPSTEQWSRIAELYRKIESPAGREFPYSAATMRAERSGDRWKIDFGPVSREQGTIRFPQVLPNQENTRAFENIIHEASIALWIKWGAGSETEIEPWRHEYASAIVISRDIVSLTLLPPIIKLNLNSLNANPTITLRSRNEGNSLPRSLRFRSLDSVIALDQTIDLDWKEEEHNSDDGDTYIKRTKPYISGPYRLQITFRGV
jgi:hypothetical protein